MFGYSTTSQASVADSAANKAEDQSETLQRDHDFVPHLSLLSIAPLLSIIGFSMRSMLP